MDTKDLLKLAAAAPIALASSGAAYIAASSEAEDAEHKVTQLEEQLEVSNKNIELLQESNKAYNYKLQKAENEIAVLKAMQASKK